MIKDCRDMFKKSIIDKDNYGNIKNFNNFDVEILIKYGKYQILEKIFNVNYIIINIK